MKKLLLITIAVLMLGCDNTSSFDAQQYHFDENQKLIDKVMKTTDLFLDSARKYSLKEPEKALVFCDSAQKYNDISKFINHNTSVPK